MTIPTIVAPNTTSPTFVTDIETFFDATIKGWGSAVESAASALTLTDLTATSTTSNVIGVGSLGFAVQLNKAFVPGMYVVISDAAAPSTNSMTGQITQYNAGTGAFVVNVLYVRGSGTKTSWIITLSGDPATSGSGTVSGDISVTNVTAAGKVRSTSKTVGIGYDTGAGGAVQLTSSPIATLNAVCGTVTLIAGNINSGLQSYQYLNNSAVLNTKDVILTTFVGASSQYFILTARAYATGQIEFVLTNKSNVNKSYTGVQINFAIIRNVNV